MNINNVSNEKTSKDDFIIRATTSFLQESIALETIPLFLRSQLSKNLADLHPNKSFGSNSCQNCGLKFTIKNLKLCLKRKRLRGKKSKYFFFLNIILGVI